MFCKRLITCVSKFLFLILTGVLCLHPAAFALAQAGPFEQPRFERFTREKTLFNGVARYIQQDQSGHIWFAGRDGLARFDGLESNIITLPNDSENSIQAIAQDMSGHFAVANTDGKLFQFNHNENRLVPLATPTQDAFRVVPGKHNHITLIGEDGAVFKYDSNMQSSFVGQFPRLSADNTLYDAVTENGVLYLATAKGGFALPLKSGSVSALQTLHQTRSYSARVFKEHIYFGTQHGLYRFTPGQARTSQQLNNIDNIYALLVDNQQRLWLGTYEKGICIVDANGVMSRRLHHDKLDQLSLVKDNVFALFADDFGSIWVSTDGGIAKYNISVNRWNHIRQSTNNALAGESINQFAEDNLHRLWVGTQNNGISIFDSQLEKATSVVISRAMSEPLLGAAQANISSAIYSLYPHSDGAMWVGHTDGITRIAIDNLAQQTPVLNQDSQQPFPPVFTISEGYESTWIGSYRDGIFRLSAQGNKHYTRENNAEHGLQSNTIYKIYRDASGELWFLTAKGMYLYNPEKDSFVNLADIIQNEHVRELEFNTLNQTHSGEYWIGSAGQGILVYDRKAGKIIKTFSQPVLNSDYINGIQVHQNLAFVSTNNGLYKINTQDYDIESFDYADGLQGSEFNNSASLKLTNQYMVFGGLYGFNYFHADDLPQTQQAAKVFIELQNQHGETLYTGSGVELGSKALTIEHHDFPLKVELSAIHTGFPENNRLRYKVGLNTTAWQEVGPKFRLSIQSLPRGLSELLVQAKGRKDAWPETTSLVKLQTIPSFWVSYTAFAIYAAVGFLFLLVLYRWRVGILNRRAQDLEAQVKARTRDIAKQKATIEEQYVKLEKLSNEKTQFFENISHEFKTPLTLILSPAKHLSQQLKQPEQQAQLGIIERNAHRLLQLIDQLLEISRLNAGLKKIEPITFDLHLFVDELLFEFTAVADKNHIQLINNIPEKTYVSFDAESLQRILLNLTSNAIKYNRENGRVTFYIDAMKTEELSPDTPANLVLHIADTGIGIKRDMLDTIFERFSRMENNRNIAGTGIGLALVKELIELNGSHMRVESQTEVGSTFSFLLPAAEQLHARTDTVRQQLPFAIADAPTPDAGVTHEPSREQEGANGQQILIVDDDADMRSFIQSVLKGYQCIVAENGKDALALATEHVPDLVLSDAMMPIMGGFELVGHLKENDITSHIPAVLLTARGSKFGRLEGLKTGADDYMTKPFDAEELCHRIENLLANRRRLQRKFAPGVGYQSPASHEQHDDREAAFLGKLNALLNKHYKDPEFAPTVLAKQMAMSDRQLQRKLKAITGLTPSEVIKHYRLNQARQRLQELQSVTDTAYEVGFSSPQVFSRSYSALFNETPSETRSQAMATQNS